MGLVLVDDLVLHNCAHQMAFISRIKKEPVNRLFAGVLRSANKKCKISVTMRHEEVVLTEQISAQFRVTLKSNSKSVDWNTNINTCARNNRSHESICVEEISRICVEIFTRFKNFILLEYLPSSEWVRQAIVFTLNTFSMTDFQPISVRKLRYSTGGYCDAFDSSVSSFKISQNDCDLLEALAYSLEEFVLLVGELPSEGSILSNRFYSALSNCHSLEKLYFCRTGKAPKILLNSDMRNCLQLLNIYEFHAYEDIAVDASWLIETFKKNKNLRKLCINDITTVNVLSDPTVLPLLAKLRSVEILLFSHSDNELISNALHIRKILQALPEKSYLNVEQIMCLPETVSIADENAAAVKTLSFWIRLSNETKKHIRLYARFSRVNGAHQRTKVVAVSQQAINDLLMQEEFAGIGILHRQNFAHTILQFNDARITLYFRLLMFKPYLTADFINEFHHVA